VDPEGGAADAWAGLLVGGWGVGDTLPELGEAALEAAAGET